MKIHHLKDPIYDFKLNLVSDCSYSDFRQLVLDNDSYECGQYRDKTIGMYVPIQETNTYYLFIQSVENIPLIAHEVLHMIFDMLESKGLELNSGSEEAYTYSFEYWMGTVLSKFNQSKDEKVKN